MDKMKIAKIAAAAMIMVGTVAKAGLDFFSSKELESVTKKEES